jgi:hypothetical protein
MATKTPGSSQTTRRRTHEKLAVSLPMELAEAVRAEARARNSPSISAFVAEALAEKIEKDQLQAVLDEILRDNPPTEEDAKWARQALWL